MEATKAGMQAALPASMARMQAKAAQLAAELELAGSPRSSSTDCPSSSTTARAQQAAPRRMSQAMAPNPRPATLDAAASQAALAQCQKLEAQVQMWKGKHLECERELQRHQESYMRREEQLKARLAELEQRLHQSGSDQGEGDGTAAHAGAAEGEPADSDRGMSEQHRSSSRRAPPKAQPLTLETVQHQMQRGVEDLLHHQRLQLRAEEAAQLRQFRGRLAEVEAQLAADKRAAAADQDSWMSKTLAVREELARTQEVAVKLDAMYRLAEEEAAQLRVQFKAQEDDRQHLIRQVLGLKRQNHHLQQQATALQEELDAIMSIELEEGQQEGGLQPLHLQQQGSSRPHSAAQQHRARPMTAGCAGGSLQAQEGACWRPSTGSPHAREAAGAGPSSPAAGGVLQQQDNSRHVIQQLQKALQCERRQLRQLRAAHTAELGRRNELQTLLLDSIQQAKQRHQAAAAAYTAQAQLGPRQQLAGAEAGAPWQQQQQCHGTAWDSSSTATGRSRQQQDKQARPVSAAPSCSGRQHSPCSAAGGGLRPSTAHAVSNAASTGGCCGAANSFSEGVLDQQSWNELLSGLLSHQRVLELLLQRSCPDLVSAAQQLHQGQQGAALPSPVQLDSQHGQPDQREQQQQLEQHGVLLQQQQDGVQHAGQQLQQVLGQQGGGGQCCEGDDMFIIEEDDRLSQASGCGDGADCQPPGQPLAQQQAGSQVAALDQQLEGSEEPGLGQHQGHRQQQQQQPGEEARAAVHPEKQLLQARWQQPCRLSDGSGVRTLDAATGQLRGLAVATPDSPPQRRRSTASASAVVAAAAAASWQPQPSGSAVTLGSMSVPLMGSFPVRKLLHSGSSHGSHSSSFNKGRQRRPESAAAATAAGGVRGLSAIGDEISFAVRPMSAAVSAAAVAGSPNRADWQQGPGLDQQQQQRQRPTGAGSSRQPQLGYKRAPFQPGAVPASDGVGSWSGRDSQGAQLMLKSFLSGQ